MTISTTSCGRLDDKSAFFATAGVPTAAVSSRRTFETLSTGSAVKKSPEKNSASSSSSPAQSGASSSPSCGTFGLPTTTSVAAGSPCDPNSISAMSASLHVLWCACTICVSTWRNTANVWASPSSWCLRAASSLEAFFSASPVACRAASASVSHFASSLPRTSLARAPVTSYSSEAARANMSATAYAVSDFCAKRSFSAQRCASIATTRSQFARSAAEDCSFAIKSFKTKASAAAASLLFSRSASITAAVAVAFASKSFNAPVDAARSWRKTTLRLCSSRNDAAVAACSSAKATWMSNRLARCSAASRWEATAAAAAVAATA
mmetsp:Transcript_86397/g.241688  ORF Transcript_86397/g.241688 Transcript_86397/m.241688 type:complete len:322 (+) Transcript_86397:457-1422(+)